MMFVSPFIRVETSAIPSHLQENICSQFPCMMASSLLCLALFSLLKNVSTCSSKDPWSNLWSKRNLDGSYIEGDEKISIYLTVKNSLYLDVIIEFQIHSKSHHPQIYEWETGVFGLSPQLVFRG